MRDRLQCQEGLLALTQKHPKEFKEQKIIVKKLKAKYILPRVSLSPVSNDDDDSNNSGSSSSDKDVEEDDSRSSAVSGDSCIQ
jgi:hypothetical protein